MLRAIYTICLHCGHLVPRVTEVCVICGCQLVVEQSSPEVEEEQTPVAA